MGYILIKRQEENYGIILVAFDPYLVGKTSCLDCPCERLHSQVAGEVSGADRAGGAPRTLRKCDFRDIFA